jgi:glucose/arabinose dehydrogenase
MRLRAGLHRFILLTFLGTSSAASQVQLTNAFPFLSFTHPLYVTHAGDGTNRVFVVQQDGLIKVFPNDTAVTSATTFLNITAKLSSTLGEQGLLGLAFHPEYESNGYFYVNYTASNPLRTVIARYSVRSDDPNRADSLSEFVILTINQPFTTHNGGMLLFGSDGYLYVGMGDGGSAGDPQNNAQNLQSLLGKILRIDVDTTTIGRNYGIPPDNPFAGNPSAGREELYAWGFRNPWRFMEDVESSLLLVADVGQNSWEEIDDLTIGLNYGWRCYEGNAPYNTSGCGPASNYTFPVKVYSHSGGNCSITGGYIYRGYRRPELTGAYIYADYCTGQTWLLRYEGGQILADSLLIDAPFPISSFGVDQDEELYICNYNGNIQRFVGPPLSGIPCSDITQFQSRCRPGGLIQARVIMANSAHAGESIEISIDQVPHSVVISPSGRAVFSMSGFSPGSHTVELTDPPGCFPPVNVVCPAGLEKAGEDEWADDLEDITGILLATALLENYPDPFNPQTTIRYVLSDNVHVMLRVYNMLGQQVRTLVDEYQDAGYKEVVWDGRDDLGQVVASGIYVYRLTAGRFSGTKSMLMMK